MNRWRLQTAVVAFEAYGRWVSSATFGADCGRNAPSVQCLSSGTFMFVQVMGVSRPRVSFAASLFESVSVSMCSIFTFYYCFLVSVYVCISIRCFFCLIKIVLSFLVFAFLFVRVSFSCFVLFFFLVILRARSATSYHAFSFTFYTCSLLIFCLSFVCCIVFSPSLDFSYIRLAED